MSIFVLTRISHTGSPSFPFSCQVVNQSDNALVVLCSYDAKLSNGSWSSAQLFPRKWHEQTRLLVHPTTLYVCELYYSGGSTLVANVSASLPLPNSASPSGMFDKHAARPYCD